MVCELRPCCKLVLTLTEDRPHLGLFLSHPYVHTSAHGDFLPDSLKGADMSLWNTAQALDLRCRVVPIMVHNYKRRSFGLFRPKFERLSRGHLVDEDDEKQLWGHCVPGHKVKWLNDDGYVSAEGEKMREVQKAYPTVRQTMINPRWVFRRIILTFFSTAMSLASTSTTLVLPCSSAFRRTRSVALA